MVQAPAPSPDLGYAGPTAERPRSEVHLVRAPSCKSWSIALVAGALLASGSQARAEEAPAVAEPAAPVKAPEAAPVEATAEPVKAPEQVTPTAPRPAEARPAEPAPTEPLRAPVAEAMAAPSAPAKVEAPPKHAGFMFDYTVLDSSSLNTVNYTNQAINYFEPMWAVGKAFLANTPFSHLEIDGRWTLTRTFAGYDPVAVHPTGDLGYAPRCSNLAQAGNGNLDPNSVQRCPTSADYRWNSGDIWLTVKNPGIYTIPGLDVKVNPSIRFILPTSIESQYATLRLATAATLSLSRSFLDHQLTFMAAFGGTKYFHRYTTPGAETDAPAVVDGAVTSNYRSAQVSSNSANFYLDPSRASEGLFNPSFGLSQIVSADYAPAELKKLSFSVLYIWLHSFAYEAAQCNVTVAGRSYDACAAADRVAKVSNGVGTAGRAVSDLQIFWATVNYQLEPWVGLSLAWINAAPQRKPDNSARQGFFSADYNAFTSVSLGATFSFNRPDEG